MATGMPVPITHDSRPLARSRALDRSEGNGSVPLHPDCPERGERAWVAFGVTQSLHSLLSVERVHVGLDAPTKADILRAMVRLAETDPAVVDSEALLQAVEARESLISTGVGQGLALPHARTSAVTDTVVSFATLAEPVDYDALDGNPVVMVVFLAGPDRERGEHVRLLSRISRVVADAETRQTLLDATSPGGVLDVIAEAEAALA